METISFISLDNRLIQFEIGYLPRDSLLYKYYFISSEITALIPKTPEGVIILNYPYNDLLTLKQYLENGDVGDLDKLIELLGFYLIYILKANYPDEFLIIKLKEEWYRRNLYNPNISNPKLQDQHHGLINWKDIPGDNFQLAAKLPFISFLVEYKIKIGPHYPEEFLNFIANLAGEYVEVENTKNVVISYLKNNVFTLNINISYKPREHIKNIYAHIRGIRETGWGLFFPINLLDIETLTPYQVIIKSHYPANEYVLKNSDNKTIVQLEADNEVLLINTNNLFNIRDEEFNSTVLPSVAKGISKRLDFPYGNINDRDLFYNVTRNSITEIKLKILDIFIIKSHNYDSLFNWNNVVIAGGSVLNELLRFGTSTDIDIFIYGLSEEEANLKIMTIISWFIQVAIYGIADIIITNNSLSLNIYEDLVSPIYRGIVHLQFVLRLYKTKSEIIHGFDVDSCCVMFDGNNFWLTERSAYAITNMINTIDFDRMSPSYEYRIIKYMKRGFAVYIPDFDPTKIDINKLEVIRINWKNKQSENILTRGEIDITKIKQPWAFNIYNEIYKRKHDIDTYTYDFGKEMANAKIEFIKNLQLNGLDIILYYFYLGKIPKNVSSCNVDYSKHPDPTSLIVSDYIRGSIYRKRDDKGFYIEIYNTRYTRERINDIINTVLGFSDVKASDGKDISRVQWKKINPGEQMTGTFHRLVYTNPELWYKGKFYQ